MKKILGLLHTLASFAVALIVYCIYAPYAIVKALTDMYEFQDFFEDVSDIVSRTRYNFQKMIQKRKTRNLVISEVKERLLKSEYTKESHLAIIQILDKMYK